MNEERRQIISDWFFKEFAAAWLELAGLTHHAQEARDNGQNADWPVILRTARQLSRDSGKAAMNLKLVGYNPATIGMALATTEVVRLAGCDIADEISDVRNYNEVCEAIAAALSAKFIAISFAASAQVYGKQRSKGIIPFLLSLFSSKVKREARQAAY
jgi:hypothetical protein